MNFLFGKGETLISKEPPSKVKPGDKENIYTFEENVNRLYPGFEEIIEDSNKLPNLAMPNNQIVFELIIHPSFLSKSYFPKELFKEFNFEIVGSKELEYSPEKISKSKTAKELEVTALYYVSINIQTLEEVMDSLYQITDEKIQEQICRIEKVKPFYSDTKIHLKEINSTTFDLIIHNSSNGINIVNALTYFISNIDSNITINHQREVDGLIFLNLSTQSKNIDQLSKFSYVRSIQPTPKLREIKTNSIKNEEKISIDSIKIKEDYLNKDLNVAILDGGLTNETTFLRPYTRYIDMLYTMNQDQELLTHGTQVTSSFLFGPLKENILTPFSRVTNYRVCDNTMDIYEVLEKIEEVLERNHPDFINLSIGPSGEIDNDTINIWTSILDNIFSTGEYFCTIAAGNDGETSYPRIGAPSDCINALGIGASDTEDFISWNKVGYSSIGPGRSPGFMKPDGLSFGGSDIEDFNVICEDNKIIPTQGTSFASPYTLRTAVGLKSLFNHKELTPIALKALMLHHTSKNKNHLDNHVGWGRFNSNPLDIMRCDDNEIKVLYQSTLDVGKTYKAIIPSPKDGYKGQINISATLCFFSPVSAEHPSSYSQFGLDVKFYRTNSNGKLKPDSSFFNLGNSFQDDYLRESLLRKQFQKWETTVKGERKITGTSLGSPYFKIKHMGREAHGGQTTKKTTMQFALVLTIIAEEMHDFYDLINQEYPSLEPIASTVELKTEL